MLLALLHPRATAAVAMAAVAVCAPNGRLLAAESIGQVTIAGVPVPGATVTATQGERKVITTSDEQGAFRLADLADGTWTVRVEMVGFASLMRDVVLPSDAPGALWELTLLPFDQVARSTPPRPPATPTAAARVQARGVPSPRDAASPAQSGAGPASGAAASTGTGFQRGFQRAEANATVAPPPAVGNPFGGDPPDESSAADGFLINGSVNNGASSPFALSRAFGNARPGQRSLYNGGFAFLGNTSAWDSRPYSFTAQPGPKADYENMQFNGTFGGPVRVPGMMRQGGNFFVGAQRNSDSYAMTQPALVPTALERGGDFSRSRDALGRPVVPIDPRTGQPFAGGVIQPDRLSPQAAALLALYPQPNAAETSGYNFQAPVLAVSQQASLQARLAQNINNRDQLVGTVGYTRGTSAATSVFGFTDATRTTSLDAAANWSHRLSAFLFLRARYQLTRTALDLTPYFAGRANVSGLAGIAGNDQEPMNWGPPMLTFSSGIESLGTAQFADNSTLTHAWTNEAFWNRGRHSMTFGSTVRRHDYDVLSQQNARGSFGFTGAATGSDLADFLLGLPQTSAIAFGNADKALQQGSYDLYANDDWRVSPSLTLNVGVRWEYESPVTEAQGRLVNLDVTDAFTRVSPVLASQPTGALTGRPYASSLMQPDKRGIQPRLGVAWRPVAGSSLVVRGGYGLYRNTNVYQPIALLLAQQPPLSTTSSVQASTARPLTLANGFVRSGDAALNTFAVDPDFRVSYSENWQVSAQRDAPGSMTVTATYLGSRGHRLLQEVLPNTSPIGGATTCAACPAGFIYLTSGGSSLRNAGQLQLRRRLRNGFTATAQYTLAKATDDAAAFGNVGLSGASIAQDWRDLAAEHAPSNFDQRHQLMLQAQYTTGAGVTGGTLVDGVRGRLFKDWTVVTQLMTGSALPLTPVYLAPVPGTGVTGSIRARLTGATVDDVPSGYYLNPGAYAAPVPGAWGTAGRNSARGPAQFSMNAGVTRTFRAGDRISLDWRFDATNILNRVTFASVNTLVGSPQFGLPNRANPMRRLQTSLRVRF